VGVGPHANSTKVRFLPGAPFPPRSCAAELETSNLELRTSDCPAGIEATTRGARRGSPALRPGAGVGPRAISRRFDSCRARHFHTHSANLGWLHSSFDWVSPDHLRAHPAWVKYFLRSFTAQSSPLVRLSCGGRSLHFGGTGWQCRTHGSRSAPTGALKRRFSGAQFGRTPAHRTGTVHAPR